MKADDEGFLYPVINTDDCTDCNICVRSCPEINYESPHTKTSVYGCYNKDEDVRLQSSSGGIFYLLCKYVIEKGGVVFGAEFDKNFNVRHNFAENMDDCKKFMGSKYSQSEIGENYKKAKEFLDYGRIVLFSGTPCQIEGLYSYLKRNYDNLITQDIVCHSVPSPKVWNEYKSILSENKNIISVNFRDKEIAWEKGLFKLQTDDGKVFSKLYSETKYMQGFLNGIFSRPSCYECKFSKFVRNSDITLGDFWGIESFYSDLYNDKGVSLLLIHSAKGKKLLNALKKQIVLKKAEPNKAVVYNQAIISSAFKNPNRETFFKDKSNVLNKVDKYLIKHVDKPLTYRLKFKDKIRVKVQKFRRKI